MKYLLTVSAFVLALLGMSYAMQRQKRDGCDAKAALVDELVRKDAGFHSVFTFTNDSNNQMLLTWAGKNSEVIVLVTLQSIGLIFFSVTYASNVYSSVDGGLTFQSLTKSFGDRLVVRPTFGLQVNQLDRDHILILANENCKCVASVIASYFTAAKYPDLTCDFFTVTSKFHSLLILSACETSFRAY